ncbi:MAG: GNAT family N-acetyltransferase [Burkholderiales bacterium]|nr:GNAT family N-acetyltransferase [Burkholderiales bacterium]
MTWTVYPAQELRRFADEWDALQRRSTDTPFLETGFLLPLLDVFGKGMERLAVLREVGTWSAAALLQPIGKGRWESFQPSQLPLGPWVGPPQATQGPELESLMRALPGLSLSLGLTQLDPRLNPRPPEDTRLRTLDYVSTSWVDIEDDFESYWNARGKNLRQNARKQRNKLQADGVTTTLECVTDPADVAPALVDYGHLESAGWKAGTGTAIHPDNEQGRFYRLMLEKFCRLGRGRIYRYRFDDKVVAMDLCIDNGPLVVILKTAYDESQRQVSPSTLMRQDQFKAWWEEGRYRRIEFYGKTLEWHTRWTEASRLLYHLTAYRWGWVRRLAAGTKPSAATAVPADATPG